MTTRQLYQLIDSNKFRIIDISWPKGDPQIVARPLVCLEWLVILTAHDTGIGMSVIDPTVAGLVEWTWLDDVSSGVDDFTNPTDEHLARLRAEIERCLDKMLRNRKGDPHIVKFISKHIDL